MQDVWQNHCQSTALYNHHRCTFTWNNSCSCIILKGQKCNACVSWIHPTRLFLSELNIPDRLPHNTRHRSIVQPFVSNSGKSKYELMGGPGLFFLGWYSNLSDLFCGWNIWAQFKTYARYFLTIKTQYPSPSGQRCSSVCKSDSWGKRAGYCAQGRK